jgi:RNA polymerase sigma-70 factor (ECF subfamily)
MTAMARWLADHILPHEPELRRWLVRRLPGGMDADDVVQEVYARLAELDDPTRIQVPRAYLYAAARSVVLQQLRRERIVAFETIAEFDRFGAASAEFEPERRALAGDELRRTAALIESLPDKCRQAFVLRKIHGLSQREIATRMRISENTVEKHIVKGLRVLMDGMKDEDHALPTGGERIGRDRHARSTRRD